jgi:hypothetical protein
MAAPDPKIKLIIHVLPLTAENAHGEYRDVALESFEARKFALSFQWQDTFEQVWHQIEERHKRNYLTPAQAS